MLSVEISRLAEVLLMAGDVGAADASLQEAFAFVEQSGERLWLAELHRLVGQVALKRQEPDHARAEPCFFKGIDIARGQEARMLELRAATDLARLWRDTGSPNDLARCWSRSSPRSRAAKPRGTSAAPARCWRTDGLPTVSSVRTAGTPYRDVHCRDPRWPLRS